MKNEIFLFKQKKVFNSMTLDIKINKIANKLDLIINGLNKNFDFFQILIEANKM